MIYQIPVDQITGLAKYGLALSCTAVSDLAESDLARYAPPEEVGTHSEAGERKATTFRGHPCYDFLLHLPFAIN